jgi:arylesterase/paraoxonase
VTGITGAEDITVHPKNGIAYISAYNIRAVEAGQDGKGDIFSYDLNSKKPVLTKLHAGMKDFRPHGISLFTTNEGPDVLFVINHSGGNHAVEKFHIVGNRLKHQKTITDPALISPNDILAISPDHFYVTNDHGTTSGLMRLLEDYLRLKLSNVVYFNGQNFSQAASDIGYANGINISADKKFIFVSCVTEQSLKIYYHDPSAPGKLKFKQKIKLNTGVDNIERDAHGNLWIGAHPQLLKFVAHAKDQEKKSPSQILRVSLGKMDAYQVDEIYLDDGDDISGSSVAAVYGNRMLIGSVFEPKILDCRIESALKK